MSFLVQARARGAVALVALGVLAAAAASAGACGGDSATGASSGGGTAGASSSTSVSVGPSTTGSGGGGAILCTSPYTNIPTGECDLLQQDCPIGQTCEPEFTSVPNSTVCVPGAGLKGPGEICEVNEECQAGLFCIDTCTPVCCSDTDVPCGGGVCVVEVTFGGSTFVQMCAFDKSCNLLEAMACDPGYECHVSDAAQGLATCSTPSPSPVGELQACTYINDCGDMQDCFYGDRICHYYCNTMNPVGDPGLGGCPAGESCVVFGAGTTIDFGVPNVGLCFPN